MEEFDNIAESPGRTAGRLTYGLEGSALDRSGECTIGKHPLPSRIHVSVQQAGSGSLPRAQQSRAELRRGTASGEGAAG